jgi:protein-disulfide isomerase
MTLWWKENVVAKKRKSRRASRVERERKRRQQRLLVVGVSVAAVVVVVALILLNSLGGGDDEPSVADVPTFQAGSRTPSDSGVTAEGFPYVGSPDAPVKLIEFSDYFCGHCGRFTAEKAPQIEEEYVSTGQVQHIVQYHALGKDARLSVVEAVACAADQGHFFDFHRLLFTRQQELGGTPTTQWRDLLMQYAQQIGLDQTAFEACWDRGEHQGQIIASIDEARRLGISSTPAFLINGRLVVGNQPYETFQAAIEEALAEAAQ